MCTPTTFHASVPQYSCVCCATLNKLWVWGFSNGVWCCFVATVKTHGSTAHDLQCGVRRGPVALAAGHKPSAVGLILLIDDIQCPPSTPHAWLGFEHALAGAPLPHEDDAHHDDKHEHEATRQPDGQAVTTTTGTDVRGGRAQAARVSARALARELVIEALTGSHGV